MTDCFDRGCNGCDDCIDPENQAPEGGDPLRAAALLALDVLEQLQGGCTDSNDGTVEAITVWCPEVIDALRAGLAAQPQPALQSKLQAIVADAKPGEGGLTSSLRAVAADALAATQAPAEGDSFQLTKSIIHDCPAIKLPQSLAAKVGGVAQIVALKGADDDFARRVVDALNRTAQPQPKGMAEDRPQSLLRPPSATPSSDKKQAVDLSRLPAFHDDSNDHGVAAYKMAKALADHLAVRPAPADCACPNLGYCDGSCAPCVAKRSDPHDPMLAEAWEIAKKLEPDAGDMMRKLCKRLRDDDHMLSQTIDEREERQQFIDDLLDAMHGPDRHEWTSAYGFNDAMEDALERLAALEAATQAPAPVDSTESLTHVIEERDSYVTELSRCRDAFPIPEPGATHENAWMLAMGDPLAVADYVTAALAALQGAAVQDGEDAARLDWIAEHWFYTDGSGCISFGFNECWDAGEHPNLRAAIDAAMADFAARLKPPVQGSQS